MWWIGWPPIGFILLGLYQGFFGHEAPANVGFSLFIAWAAIWYWTVWRLKQLRCPRCGEKAIASPLFFMRDVKCKNCGLAYNTEDIPQNPAGK
jgi:rubredoxin